MAQDKRKEVGIMKEGMIMEESVLPEVLAELLDTTPHLTQQANFMHLNIP
jgi:hypothetical protein